MQYRIKEGAPPHYVPGRGMLGPGDTFEMAKDYKGEWLELVRKPRAAKAEEESEEEPQQENV